MINYGIDLGTTNSAIAKFEQGKIKVFPHPISQKLTLPSVIAYRGGRLLVGEKAREFLKQENQFVAAGFKRKMGTSETYALEGQDYNPTELSSLVLRELKNFLPAGETPEAAVVTIPASFDTIQSNATKEAGQRAGFQEVQLLQEPIAASLAYANQASGSSFEEGQWLVYDLGGGTFDVALVRIQDGEMKVLDHEGDNFLGGNDLDQAIVDQIVIPYLESLGDFDNLESELKSASGKYQSLYAKLLLLAEEAKITLSEAEQADLEFEAEDDRGEKVEAYLTLPKDQFENLLEPYLARTTWMMARVLQRNQLKPADLKFILMVGGSTYIPYVRREVSQRLGIPVNTQVDPTTAVAVGAAYYAGTRKRSQATKTQVEQGSPATALKVRTAYQKATQEKEEYFTAVVEDAPKGLQYRLTRLDGGFDSGLMPLPTQIKTFLPLVPDSFNEFQLKVFDAQGQGIPIDLAPIGITQGKFSVVGQPLPLDISLEVDDTENQTTTLEVIFEKNDTLPLKKTLVKQMTRTITKNSEERLTINVVEGPRTALPSANQPIGFISISGQELSRDLVRGSDVEITLQISESRDLTINAYLMMTDQEFENVFEPSVRTVNLARLHEELQSLAEKMRQEIAEAEEQGNYEQAQKLVDMEFEILELADKAKKMPADDATDARFQIEDRKRQMAREVDELTRDKLIVKAKQEYFDTKRGMEFTLENYEPSAEDQASYQTLLDQEKAILATNSTLKIRDLIDQVNRLNWRIRWNNSRYLRDFFLALAYGRFGNFTQPERAQQLIAQGQQAIEQDNDDQLRVTINQLTELLPPVKREQIKYGGTGIG
ncbi:MAG: Hsp70 family protein [Bacteroidota bacterium]